MREEKEGEFIKGGTVGKERGPKGMESMNWKN